MRHKSIGKNILIFLFLFCISIIYRLRGLSLNYPFWVDEFSTGVQARLLMQHGFAVFTRPDIFFEHHNITTYALVALFFKLFGISELTARLPFVILGSLVPIALYLLTKKLTDTKTAITATLLAAFSYFQITWSRQARGYMLIQLIVLSTLYLYFKLLNINKKAVLDYALLIALLFFGILTHSFIYLLVAAFGAHIFIINRSAVISTLKKPWPYAVALIPLVLGYQTGFFTSVFNAVKIGFVGNNINLWYYHSFLWREYTLITFLGVMGLFALCVKNPKKFSVILIFVTIHLIFIGLLFAHYISKYTLPIFPLLLMGTAYALTILSDSILKNKSSIVRFVAPVLLALFIIGNGDKFVTKPKAYYSINHDFREIANIDYHQIYRVINEKGRIEEGKTAVIDSWIDRPKWYLGTDPQMPFYIVKWNNESDVTKQIHTRIDEQGNKLTIGRGGVRVINTLADLERVQSKYTHGFILLDDTTLPKEIQDYVIKNFKKELYLDHYPLDDNPYSIWPATLYSWGIK